MFVIIKVVLLNEEHTDNLLKLENKCFSKPWTANMFVGDLKSEHTRYLGAFAENDDLVGYIGMWNAGDAGEITNVAVHPDYRRKGIATLLMDELCSFSQDSGLKQLNLEVRESNGGAIALYEEFGFEKVGLRKNYYKNPAENALLMTKTF